MNTYGLDPLELERRTRLAQKQTRDFEQSNNEWANHAQNIKNDNASLIDKLNYNVYMVERYQDLANEAGVMLITANKGNTVAGFTNSPAQEMELLIAQLLKISHLVSDPHEYWNHRAKAVANLSVSEKKEVNLMLLCRMEWIDWGLQVDVLAKFGAAVTEAFLNGNNNQIRNRELLSYYTQTSKEYHVLRDKAMDPNQGVTIRADFESTRYNYWKNKVRYKHFSDGTVCPNAKLTLEADPDITLDSHLIGGIIAEKFGINIRTLKKDVCFIPYLAHKISNGLENENLSYHYI